MKWSTKVYYLLFEKGVLIELPLQIDPATVIFLMFIQFFSIVSFYNFLIESSTSILLFFPWKALFNIFWNSLRKFFLPWLLSLCFYASTVSGIGFVQISLLYGSSKCLNCRKFFVFFKATTYFFSWIIVYWSGLFMKTLLSEKSRLYCLYKMRTEKVSILLFLKNMNQLRKHIRKYMVFPIDDCFLNCIKLELYN